MHASPDDGEPSTCPGTIHDFRRRCYPPTSDRYERTFLLRWCGDCRTFASCTVHVDRATILDDPLANLAPDVRERLVSKELHLVRHLDCLRRRGA